MLELPTSNTSSTSETSVLPKDHVDKMQSDDSWNLHVGADYIKQANWPGAILMLLVAFAGPVLVGAAFLYQFGVDKESTIARFIKSTEAPPVLTSTVESEVVTQTNSQNIVEPTTQASSPKSNTVVENLTPEPTVSDAAAPTAISDSDKLDRIESLLKQLDTQKELRTERLYWDSIKDSTDQQMLSAYLKRYPNGEFVAIAQIRLDAQRDRQNEQVRKLLRLSQQAYEQNKFTIPTDDNAVKWAEAVLEIEDTNTNAQTMLRRVIDTYLLRGANAAFAGNRLTARQLTDRAKNLHTYASSEQQLLMTALSSSLDNESNEPLSFSQMNSVVIPTDSARLELNQSENGKRLSQLLSDVTLRLASFGQAQLESSVSEK